jgi:hypothetical protein
MIVKQTDTVPPVVTITGVSIYGGNKANGHIDFSDTLPAAFDQATGVMDTDDKVSGKITLSGTAFDDQRITSIWMNIDDFTFTGSSDTATVPGYAKVATYDAGVEGSWATEGDFDTNGWKFNVTQVSLDQDGHNINWSLDWNTAKLGSVAATDIVSNIQVRDRSAALNDID